MTNRDVEKAMGRHIAQLGSSEFILVMVLVGVFSLLFGILFTYREYRVNPHHDIEDMTLIYNLFIFPLSTALIAGFVYRLYCHMTKLNEWQLNATEQFPWNEKGKVVFEKYQQKKSSLSIAQLQKIYKHHMKEELKKINTKPMIE